MPIRGTLAMVSEQQCHCYSPYAEDVSTEGKLNQQLEGWLDAVGHEEAYAPPITGCKAVIAPHAGYSYSGAAAGWAYKSIDTTGM
jgi:AmmeMemoRadiSam system protein B